MTLACGWYRIAVGSHQRRGNRTKIHMTIWLSMIATGFKGGGWGSSDPGSGNLGCDNWSSDPVFMKPDSGYVRIKAIGQTFRVESAVKCRRTHRGMAGFEGGDGGDMDG